MTSRFQLTKEQAYETTLASAPGAAEDMEMDEVFQLIRQEACRGLASCSYIPNSGMLSFVSGQLQGLGFDVETDGTSLNIAWD